MYQVNKVIASRPEMYSMWYWGFHTVEDVLAGADELEGDVPEGVDGLELPHRALLDAHTGWGTEGSLVYRWDKMKLIPNWVLWRPFTIMAVSGWGSGAAVDLTTLWRSGRVKPAVCLDNKRAQEGWNMRGVCLDEKRAYYLKHRW